MKRTIKMDRAGRVVIPRAIREKYGLIDGDHELDVLESPDGITLRPSVEEIPATQHESGWIVFASGDPETIDPVEAVETDRRRRHRVVRGHDQSS